MKVYHYPTRTMGQTERYVIMCDDKEVILDFEAAKYILPGLAAWVSSVAAQHGLAPDIATAPLNTGEPRR